MTALKPSEPWAMTADQAAQRGLPDWGPMGHAARAELALRNELEVFARGRWPQARLCHEMVMGEGKVRADMVAVGPQHIVAFEIKGDFDDTSRLVHQVFMYALCVPEVWMVVATGHIDTARLIRHLLPQVGLLTGAGARKVSERRWETELRPVELAVEAEAVPRPPVPEMMLRMCWAEELRGICERTNTAIGKRAPRDAMTKALLELPADTLQREVCTALRGREARWRADPAIEPERAP